MDNILSEYYRPKSKHAKSTVGVAHNTMSSRLPPRFVFLSHSIGSHMVQRLLILRPDILSCTIGTAHLMPFIRMDAGSDQAKLDWAGAHPSTLIRVAKCGMQCLRWLPFSIANHMAKGIMDDEKKRVLAIRLLRQPTFARHFFELGTEEIRDVPETVDVSFMMYGCWLLRMLETCILTNFSISCLNCNCRWRWVNPRFRHWVWSPGNVRLRCYMQARIIGRHPSKWRNYKICKSDVLSLPIFRLLTWRNWDMTTLVTPRWYLPLSIGAMDPFEKWRLCTGIQIQIFYDQNFNCVSGVSTQISFFSQIAFHTTWKAGSCRKLCHGFFCGYIATRCRRIQYETTWQSAAGLAWVLTELKFSLSIRSSPERTLLNTPATMPSCMAWIRLQLQQNVAAGLLSRLNIDFYCYRPDGVLNEKRW